MLSNGGLVPGLLALTALATDSRAVHGQDARERSSALQGPKQDEDESCLGFPTVVGPDKCGLADATDKTPVRADTT
jgi:hypothetical protein